MPGNVSSPAPGGVFLSFEDVRSIQFILPSDAIAHESSFMGVILETALFGVYSLLVVLTSIVLVRRGIRSPARALVLFACIVMYAMAATHFSLTINWIFQSNKQSVVAQTMIAQCLTNLTASAPCTLERYVNAHSIPVGSDCLPASMLTVAMILSDAIVLWRAWVLWGRNRTVLAVSAVLLLATLGLAIKSTSYQCHLFTTSWLEFVDPFGVASWMLSWVTNVWATGLIGWKAWRHRQLIKSDLRGAMTSGTQAEKALMLFLDSGILYCVLWTVLSVAVAIELHYKDPSNLPSTNMGRFVLGVENLRNSALVDLIGIYPTLLVTLTALSTSYIERTVQLDTIVMSQMQFGSNRASHRTAQRHTLSLPDGSVRSVGTGSSEMIMTPRDGGYKSGGVVKGLVSPVAE